MLWLSEKVGSICFYESFLKMMKNAFSHIAYNFKNEIWLVNMRDIISTREYYSLKIMQEKKAEETSFRLILFFKKALYEVEASGLHLSFSMFW